MSTAPPDILAILNEPAAGAFYRSAILSVLAEVAAEHDRAIALYPDSIHLPDGTGETGARQWSEDMARNACNRAHREGRLTHAHVFEEEAMEVLNARTPEDLRKELIQVAAMCLKWVLCLDGRARP